MASLTIQRVSKAKMLCLRRQQVHLRLGKATNVTLILARGRVDGIVCKGASISFGDLFPRLQRQLGFEVAAGLQVDENQFEVITSLDAPPSVGQHWQLLSEHHGLPCLLGG